MSVRASRKRKRLPLNLGFPEGTAMKRVFRVLAAAAFIVGITLTLAAPAQAAGAVRTPFTLVFHETFEGSIPECFDPDLVGTNVATETITGQIVETSSGVFAVHSTEVLAYRVDFPNGMYSYGQSTAHFSFIATPNVIVSTEVGKEPRTVYAADGTPVAQLVIHAGTHITFQDLNGDGQPQPNEISANVDRFYFTCH